MFNFVGQVLVLQPDAEHPFVGGEGYHPMLPPSPNLFMIRQPSVLGAVQVRGRPHWAALGWGENAADRAVALDRGMAVPF